MSIYSKRTFKNHVFICLIITVLILLVASIFGVRDLFAAYITVTILLIYIVITFLKDQKIKKTLARLANSRKELALVVGASYSPCDFSEIPMLRNIAPMQIENGRNKQIMGYIDAGEWQYFDYSHNYYRQLRGIKFLAGTVYYGVIFSKLPCNLPNVFFDSKKTRGRQFRFTFSRKQLYKFEGNFNKYFSAYTPENFTKDSLSFINQDVMEALIDASEYDIEIVSDMICLYGPIYTESKDIILMSQKLAQIKHQLLKNTLTHRN